MNRSADTRGVSNERIEVKETNDDRESRMTGDREVVVVTSICVACRRLRSQWVMEQRPHTTPNC